jgi:hypothetical protein
MLRALWMIEILLQANSIKLPRVHKSQLTLGNIKRWHTYAVCLRLTQNKPDLMHR